MVGLRLVELTFLCSGDERAPLRFGEDEDRPVAVIFGITEADAIGKQPTYLDAIAVKVAEGALPPRGSADIG